MLSLTTFMALAKTLVDAKGRLGTLLLAAVMNALVFAILAMSFMIWKEGGVKPAYHTYLQPRASMDEIDRQARIALTQQQLLREAETQRRIKSELRRYLGRNPIVARVRLAAIHDGTVGVGGKHEWKFDIIAAEAQGGHEQGPLVQNELIAGWPFLSEILEGRCAVYAVQSLPMTPGRARLDSLGVRRVMACPARTGSGETLGAVFTMYDRDEDAPVGEDLVKTSRDALSVGQTLSSELMDYTQR